MAGLGYSQLHAAVRQGRQALGGSTVSGRCGFVHVAVAVGCAAQAADPLRLHVRFGELQCNAAHQYVHMAQTHALRPCDEHTDRQRST